MCVCALKNFEIYMHEPNCLVFNRNTSSNNEPKQYIVYHCSLTISFFLLWFYFHQFSFFSSSLYLLLVDSFFYNSKMNTTTITTTTKKAIQMKIIKFVYAPWPKRYTLHTLLHRHGLIIMFAIQS